MRYIKQKMMKNVSESTDVPVHYDYGWNTSYPDQSALIMAAEDLEIVVLPIIVSTGLVGNSLALIVFLSKSLRSISCILYLAMKAVSDVIFLLCLLIIWLEKVNVSFFHSHGVCQIVIYLTYVTGFVSVWLVVLVTYENFVRLCFPLSVMKYCKCIKAKQYIGLLIFVSSALYSFSLLSNHVVNYDGFSICTPKNEAVVLLTIFTYIDTVLTLFLPSVIILGLLITTLVTTKTKKRLVESGNTQNLQKQVTRLLTAISVTIWGLNLPSHIIRIRLLILALIRDQVIISPAEYFIQHFFQMLYYSGFAINIFIYLSFGHNFRHVFCKSLKTLKFSLICLSRNKTHPSQNNRINISEEMDTTELGSTLLHESEV